MKPLELLISEGEGLTIEFKEKYSPKIAQDIVGFANAKGGTILLGVADNGNIKGERLTNPLKSQIIDLGRNCKPPIPIHLEKLDDHVIAVRVPEGTEKPYTCSEGFFKRFDALTQKLTPSEVREIFRNHASTDYESNVNPKAKLDDLSLIKINRFLKESGSKLVIDAQSVRDFLESIRLIRNGEITNAALLMFAKDINKFLYHSQMFLVAYKGTEGTTIFDRKYVRDDLLTQYREAIDFCEKHLNLRSEIENGIRKDFFEIPMNALRETIANAVIHRDYSMTGTNIQLEIHEDRIVISNPGGLPEGLSLAKLGTKSIRRNDLIADIFSRMHIAERFGSGIKRVKQQLHEAHCEAPKYESDDFFTVTLFRPEEHRKLSSRMEVEPNLRSRKKIRETAKKTKPITSERILQILIKNPEYSQEILAKKINLSIEGVRYHIKKLQKEGRLKRSGSRKTGSWKVLK